MIPRLEIERFRTFSHLHIGQLGRVNLIVGRNNVGKTMLLEALRVYASGGHPAVLYDLLYDRDEILLGGGERQEPADAHLQIATLFHDRMPPIGKKAAIRILSGPNDLSALEIYIGAVRRERTESSPPGYRYHTLGPGDALDDPRIVPALTVVQGGRTQVIPFDDIAPYRRYLRRSRHAIVPQPAFVPATRIDMQSLTRQWDSVALHDAEERVKECLRVLLPVDRIMPVEHPVRTDERLFIVRVSGSPQPVPLRSLGDGMLRMFQIALALETATNGDEAQNGVPSQGVLFPGVESVCARGILLIDEVENGIHYSVLPDLWRSIIRAAKANDVQVFATTHSWDCVEAFQQAALADTEARGVLIRLERTEGGNKAVTFSEDELAIATRDKIEVR